VNTTAVMAVNNTRMLQLPKLCYLWFICHTLVMGCFITDTSCTTAKNIGEFVGMSKHKNIKKNIALGYF